MKDFGPYENAGVSEEAVTLLNGHEDDGQGQEWDHCSLGWESPSP
jgi:hypothetical protein